MTGRKPNISAWCLTALAAILLVGCLAVSVGTAYARYREEVAGELGVQIRKPEQVYLWSGTDPEADYVPGTGSWVEGESGLELSFLVTNTDSKQEIPRSSQKFRLRLVGSLGTWKEDSGMVLRLTYTYGDTAETVEASVTPIKKDTKLYSEFGEGWLFTFEDDDEEELCWKLAGGERSTIAMQLVLEGSTLTDPGLLTLQVLGDMTQE